MKNLLMLLLLTTTLSAQTVLSDTVYLEKIGNIYYITTTVTYDNLTQTSNKQLLGDSAIAVPALLNYADFQVNDATYLVRQLVNTEKTRKRLNYYNDGSTDNNNMLFYTNYSTTFSEKMRITSTGNVGIGTCSPANTLDVRAASASLNISSTTGTNFALISARNGSNDSFFGVESCTSGTVFVSSIAYSTLLGNFNNKSLQFGTCSNIRMTINSSGNVGIGTTSPITTSGTPTLTIGSGGSQTPSITLFSETGQGQISFARGLTSTDPYDGYIFYNNTSRLMAFGTAATQRMTITSGGTIAIGATAITDPYTASGGGWQTVQFGKGGVLGAYRTADESMTGFNTYVATDGSNKAIICNVGGTAIRYYDDRITFNTISTSGTSQTQTERMRITNNGNVLVATTTASYNAVNRGNLTIGGVSTSLLAFQTNNTDRSYLYHDGTNYSLVNNSSGGGVYISSNGGGVVLSSAATSWASSSDERLKNINYIIENAVSKLSSLRTVNFSWKSDQTKKEYLGLIAQDVEKVFPQVISKNNLHSNIDDVQIDSTEYLSVRYTELIPVLVKAIQEQQCRINLLETCLGVV